MIQSSGAMYANSPVGVKTVSRRSSLVVNVSVSIVSKCVNAQKSQCIEFRTEFELSASPLPTRKSVVC